MTVILDVAAHPARPGSRAEPALGLGARLYHLRNSRSRARLNGETVASPRHFLLYRVIEPGLVGIARLLDDRMDLARHHADDFGEAEEETP